MIMPFGKYRGVEIDDIPFSYLDWLWNNVNLGKQLRYEVAKALFSPNPTDCVDVISLVDIITVFRKMAFKWHPDRGGTNEAMQAVNEFYEELRNVG
jgi:hypothetical protein